METQTFALMDLARERHTRLLAEHGATTPVRAVSDYEVIAATVFPPRGAVGNWRERLVRVLDRRLGTGLPA